MFGERAHWTLPTQLAASAANAARMLAWQFAKAYGDEKAVKGLEPPVPLLAPWERVDDAQDGDDTGPQLGPISEATEAGTRRFGSARMSTAEVDDWLGWGSSTN